ncbi:MAG: FkbM family methyltransferase [Sphingobacteriaceae bacterium]|nr:MAG: FkbM family methyltransferase [Sphingobacteriaceae bacterium]
MKRFDRIKLNFTRNWNLPGKERLSTLLNPSDQLKADMHNGIVWLNTEDIAIYTTADNYIEWTILSSGTYEDEISKLIRISLREGDAALDIGANIGLQSIRMSKCAGISGKVYSFEPLAHLQEKFNKNISLNKAGNVTLFPCALSDAAAEIDLAINKQAWNQGTFSLDGFTQGNETQRVVVKVADEIEEIKNMHSLALVKIDVEGFEYHVLRGLKQTLQAHKPRIIFEYDDNYWLKTGQDIRDCYAFLQVLNYTCYQITQVGCQLISNATEIVSGNLFCIFQSQDEK